MRKFAAALLAAALFLPCAASAADMSSVATLRKPAPGGVPWTPKDIAKLHAAIAKILNAPTLRGAQVGFILQDTVRGTPLYSQNADQDFMPASNFKLLVGSAALQRLGTSFAYTTTVSADAAAQGGVIRGNVYLHGGGDALLSAKDLDDAAAALAASGIKRIDGSLITDATRFDSQRYGYGWSWDDFPYYYAPVVTALELEDGVVHAFMSPGASAGAPVALRVWPESSTFTIDNRMTTGPADSKDTSDLSRVWDKPTTIELTGSYPLGAKESGDLRASVPDPESYAGDVFMRALNAHGITIGNGVKSGKMPATATQLWSHNSEPMPQLLADFWYPSDNLMGELLLKELGVVQAGEPGTDANGRLLEQAYLKSIGVDPLTVTISDGSGLSQYDRISPHDLLTILQADWNSPNRDVVLDALPVAGVRGTLQRAYLKTPAERMVFAKTGSISHVRTISGYVITKTHGPVTFSFMVNQWMDEDQPGGAGRLAQVRADLLSHIAQQ
jgi:D-alanyl-D-alanine carboxypeptidase/D-alanyl-D-alanine-endopeptidase (penicillin-binding protein 4)